MNLNSVVITFGYRSISWMLWIVPPRSIFMVKFIYICNPNTRYTISCTFFPNQNKIHKITVMWHHFTASSYIFITRKHITCQKNLFFLWHYNIYIWYIWFILNIIMFLSINNIWLTFTIFVLWNDSIMSTCD